MITLVVHQVSDALDELHLVDLVGNFGDDDRLAAAGDVLDRALGTHQEAAAAGAIGLRNAAATVDEAAGRKVRALHVLQNLGQPRMRIVHQLDGCVDDFRQVVWRNVGRHADRDAVRAIHDQVWNARRQHRGLERALVVVRHQVDRVLVDVGQHLARDAHHARFGVPHGRRRIAVHRAEVALAIDHGIAQAEGLRQAHHGVVDGRVAMRMVLAHCLADHLGALGVLLVVLQTHLVHRVQDAAMHRLEAVANIGQRTADDDRHRIVEIRPPHLVFNVDGNHVGGAGTGGRRCAVPAVAVRTAEGKLRILIVCHR